MLKPAVARREACPAKDCRWGLLTVCLHKSTYSTVAGTLVALCPHFACESTRPCFAFLVKCYLPSNMLVCYCVQTRALCVLSSFSPSPATRHAAAWWLLWPGCVNMCLQRRAWDMAWDTASVGLDGSHDSTRHRLVEAYLTYKRTWPCYAPHQGLSQLRGPPADCIAGSLSDQDRMSAMRVKFQRHTHAHTVHVRTPPAVRAYEQTTRDCVPSRAPQPSCPQLPCPRPHAWPVFCPASCLNE